MNKDKKLIATSLALAAMLGTSAFAESRPSNETRRRGDASSTVRRERSTEARRGDASGTSVSRNSGRVPAGRVEARGEVGRGSGSYQRGDRGDRSTRGRSGQTYERSDRNRSGSTQERSDRTYDRSDRNRSGSAESYRRGDGNRSGTHQRGDRNRSGATWDRNRSGSSRGGNDTYRRGGDSRGGHSRGGRYESQHRSYGNRQHYHHRGRISNYARYGNGYRVWVIGAPYPFYVPLSHWHRDRFRIGLTIGIGGYYNPGGYYDYYDGYYDGYNRAASRGELRGVVESVDYRRDTFVVRNDATGSFVTVVMRDRRGDVRAGDYVEVSGDWTRSGVFTAYDVDLLD